MTYKNWLLYKQGKYEMKEDDDNVVIGSSFTLDNSNEKYILGIFEEDPGPKFYILKEDTGEIYSSLNIDNPSYNEYSISKLTNDQLDIIQNKISNPDSLYSFNYPLWSAIVLSYFGSNPDTSDKSYETIVDYTKLKEE